MTFSKSLKIWFWYENLFPIKKLWALKKFQCKKLWVQNLISVLVYFFKKNIVITPLDVHLRLLIKNTQNRYHNMLLDKQTLTQKIGCAFSKSLAMVGLENHSRKIKYLFGLLFSKNIKCSICFLRYYAHTKGQKVFSSRLDIFSVFVFFCFIFCLFVYKKKSCGRHWCAKACVFSLCARVCVWRKLSLYLDGNGFKKNKIFWFFFQIKKSLLIKLTKK